MASLGETLAVISHDVSSVYFLWCLFHSQYPLHIRCVGFFFIGRSVIEALLGRG